MSTTKPSASASADFGIHGMALKIPEFWPDKACVWFAESETQFAVKGATSSLTKCYYCVGAFRQSDAAQIVDLI